MPTPQSWPLPRQPERHLGECKQFALLVKSANYGMTSRHTLMLWQMLFAAVCVKCWLCSRPCVQLPAQTALLTPSRPEVTTLNPASNDVLVMTLFYKAEWTLLSTHGIIIKNKIRNRDNKHSTITWHVHATLCTHCVNSIPIYKFSSAIDHTELQGQIRNVTHDVSAVLDQHNSDMANVRQKCPQCSRKQTHYLHCKHFITHKPSTHTSDCVPRPQTNLINSKGNVWMCGCTYQGCRQAQDG